RTCPGPGTGISRSTTSKAAPAFGTCAAFIFAIVSFLLDRRPFTFRARASSAPGSPAGSARAVRIPPRAHLRPRPLPGEYLRHAKPVARVPGAKSHLRRRECPIEASGNAEMGVASSAVGWLPLRRAALRLHQHVLVQESGRPTRRVLGLGQERVQPLDQRGVA